ncbi:MAG: hypothetical protein QM485_04090 [Flavobacteriaceae bacterium]
MRIANTHNTKYLVITVCFSILLGLGSCGKDSPLSPNCLSGSWIKNLEKEISAWSAASQKYGDDPTKANCENYKKAGVDYINALGKIKNCVPGGSTSDFEKEQAEAKKELNAIVCE